MMKLTYMGDGRYELDGTNGRSVILDHYECNCIAEYFRHNEWRGNIEDVIDDDEDSYDFSEISRDEFVDMCVDELQRKYENCEICSPNYADLVCDMAEENDILKE